LSSSFEISVPGADGLPVFLIKQGMWNCAIGHMVFGCNTLAPN
jgi:hypothetical protein